MVLGLSVVSTGMSLVLPYLSKDLVDRALLGRDPHALWRTMALFAGAAAAGFALNAVSGLRYTRVSADILFDMRLALYRHLQELSPRFYARTRIGDILSRINNDIGEIQRIAAEMALAWVGNVLFLTGSVAMLVWLDWQLFLLSTALMPASVWALIHYRRRLETRAGMLRQASADIGSFLVETLQGVRLVVTSNAQEREAERFRGKNAGFVKALMSMQLLSYLAGGLPGLILSASTMVVFLYGGHEVIRGTMRLGTLVAFLAYQMRLFPPIHALMGLYASLATVRVSLGRVGEIFDVAPEVEDGCTALERVHGEMRFEGVSFSFDRGGALLENVDFDVRAGEMLAIVGPSGCGKSTIADLMVRLLDPDKGTVRLDGNDVRDLRLADVRRHVVLVDQEPFVFHSTVAENIRYARPEASDAEVEEAARAAAIDGLGLDTVVGERGTALSAGERQRVAIARAFLTNASVLVLDEPTAALDPMAERRMGAVLRGRTTVVITHRLELARLADRVLVLDGARIVESGVPDALGAQRGRFAELFATAAR